MRTFFLKRSCLKKLSQIISIFVMTFFIPYVQAQAYPIKPVKIVVGFSPSGPVDNLARIIAQGLSEHLNQAFVVDNKPGASSMIAAQYVANFEPDGYNLLMVASTHAINPGVYKKLAFNTETDFSPIALIAENPFVLVVPSKLKIKTVEELNRYLKSSTANMSYASAGIGGLPHLAGELYKQQFGLDVVHIPYKGAAPASIDLLAGRVSFMFNNMQSALPHIKDGNLQALAVTGLVRSNVVSDAPTFKELGYSDLAFSGWYGLLGPKEMKPELLQKINQAVFHVLQDPKIISKIKNSGAEVRYSSAQEFKSVIHQDIIKWSAVAKKSNITAE